MGKRIALVGCVKMKNPTPLPARELYCSPWFRKASKYAERVSDEWYILSAKHGLLAPETIIEPYERTLNGLSARARRDWAKRVLKDLGRLLSAGDHVVILAGHKYRGDLLGPICEMGCTVETPMEGLGFYKQLSWLKRQVG